MVNRAALRTCIAVAAACLAGFGTAAGAGQTRNSPLRLWIDDTYATMPQLLSDGGGTEAPNQYIDHGLAGGDPCVTGFIQSDGFTFVNLDYRQDVGAGCSATLGITPRTYRLRFPAASGACDALALTADNDGLCTLAVADSPRFRFEKLFANKRLATPVALPFRHNGASYEVRADASVPFTVAGNVRTLTHDGSATLWKIGSASQSPEALASFTFLFEVAVERVGK